MRPSGIRKLVVFVALACVPAFSALACLWDNDTLRAEARGLPGAVEIITGRFERNPPLYFEMRLKRSADQIKADARAWDAYDNAAVACDRLGRDDDAIGWMMKKKEAMDAEGSESPALVNHRYRYLANIGTFYVHRWFGRGANRGDMSDIQQGIQLIQAAITLNPDAHFGRERYQLLAMRWIMQPPTDGIDDAGAMFELPTIFCADEKYRSQIDARGRHVSGDLKDAGLANAVQGLTGLIALGNAWESVDVFYALASALSDQQDSSLARLAELRCMELIRNGKKSAHPSSPSGDDLAKLIELHGYIARDVPDIDAYFQRARTAAESWHAHRMEFMLRQLNAGMHPDTDPNFWDGYVEEPAPSMPNGILGISRGVVMETWVPVIVALAIAVPVGTVLIMVSRRIRKSRARRATVSG